MCDGQVEFIFACFGQNVGKRFVCERLKFVDKEIKIGELGMLVKNVGVTNMRGFVLTGKHNFRTGGGTSSSRGLREFGYYKMKFISKLAGKIIWQKCEFCKKFIPKGNKKRAFLEKDSKKLYFHNYKCKRNFMYSLKPNFKARPRRVGL